MNAFNIQKTFQEKKKKNWDRVYFCVDLHDVVIEGKYSRLNDGANFAPNAIRVLSQLSYRNDIVLILWTSSHDDAVADIKKRMDSHGIEFRYFNSNPEVPDTDLCKFSGKFYFNVLLDDKAGFEIDKDFFTIEEELKKAGAWDKPVSFVKNEPFIEVAKKIFDTHADLFKNLAELESSTPSHSRFTD